MKKRKKSRDNGCLLGRFRFYRFFWLPAIIIESHLYSAVVFLVIFDRMSCNPAKFWSNKTRYLHLFTSHLAKNVVKNYEIKSKTLEFFFTKILSSSKKNSVQLAWEMQGRQNERAKGDERKMRWFILFSITQRNKKNAKMLVIQSQRVIIHFFTPLFQHFFVCCYQCIIWAFYVIFSN